jgi:16S rRNA (cytosine1402-N4)-methyltransferase
LARNPRARSAKLRVGIRTEAPAKQSDRKALGLPHLKGER